MRTVDLHQHPAGRPATPAHAEDALPLPAAVSAAGAAPFVYPGPAEKLLEAGTP